MAAGPSVRWPTLPCGSSSPHLQCQIAGTSGICGRGAISGQVRDCGGKTFYCLCWEPFRVGLLPRVFMERHWQMWIGCMVGRRHCLLLLMCLLWVIFVCSCCIDAWWFIVTDENDTKIYCLHLWIRTKRRPLRQVTQITQWLMLKWWIMLLQHRRTERQEKWILRQWKNQIMLRRMIQSRLAKNVGDSFWAGCNCTLL